MVAEVGTHVGAQATIMEIDDERWCAANAKFTPPGGLFPDYFLTIFW